MATLRLPAIIGNAAARIMLSDALGREVRAPGARAATVSTGYELDLNGVAPGT